MGTVTIKWVEDQLMSGLNSNGTPIVMGHSTERVPEWKGLRPADLLLLAAASCSGYDVVMILRKQREPLEGLEVICRAEQLPDPPYRFTKIHLQYRIKGPVNPQKVARAISLSHEKYCSVTNSLHSEIELSSDFEVI